MNVLNSYVIIRIYLGIVVSEILIYLSVKGVLKMYFKIQYNNNLVCALYQQLPNCVTLIDILMVNFKTFCFHFQRITKLALNNITGEQYFYIKN